MLKQTLQTLEKLLKTHCHGALKLQYVNDDHCCAEPKHSIQYSVIDIGSCWARQVTAC